MQEKQRVEIVGEMLGQWVDAGLDLDEMTKAAELLADVAEACQRKNIPFADHVVELRKLSCGESDSQMQKEANLAYLGSIFKNLGKRVADLGFNLSGKVISKAIDMGGTYGPLALAAAPVATLGAGYAVGDLLGSHGGDKKEVEESIRNRELLSTLRAEALAAKARNEQRLLSQRR